MFWTLFCGVGLTVGYVFLSNLLIGRPYGILSILFFVIGCGVGLTLYLREHFRVAHTKREDFVRAGGDPTGITPWMFGAMSGRITKDGVCEWYPLRLQRRVLRLGHQQWAEPGDSFLHSMS